jgi:tRNA threonylcarbamoyladenosine biosynthesis protein TsaE
MEKRIVTLADLAAEAEAFLMGHPRGGIVGLTGDLGAGKTAFVRLCVEALARRSGTTAPRVTSPSFVLHQHYDFGGLATPIDHFDLYRLDKADREALINLGYFEIVEAARAKRGFVFIEWPERETPEGVLGIEINIRIALKADHRLMEIS